jgi:uncharacterized protein YkwD
MEMTVISSWLSSTSGCRNMCQKAFKALRTLVYDSGKPTDNTFQTYLLHAYVLHGAGHYFKSNYFNS